MSRNLFTLLFFSVLLLMACGDDPSSDTSWGNGDSILVGSPGGGATGGTGAGDGSGPGMEPPLGGETETDDSSGPGMEPPVSDGDGAPADGASMGGDTGGNVSDPTAQPDGACDNEADMAIVGTPEFDAVTDTCGNNCVVAGGVDCVTNCVATQTGISTECARCYDGIVNCSAQGCWDMCIFDSEGEACRNCVASMCEPAFDQCRGIPPEEDPPPAP